MNRLNFCFIKKKTMKNQNLDSQYKISTFLGSKTVLEAILKLTLDLNYIN